MFMHKPVANLPIYTVPLMCIQFNTVVYFFLVKSTLAVTQTSGGQGSEPLWGRCFYHLSCRGQQQLTEPLLEQEAGLRSLTVSTLNMFSHLYFFVLLLMRLMGHWQTQPFFI